MDVSRRLFEVEQGPGSLALGVRIGEQQDALFKVRFENIQLGKLRVRLKTLHCLNPEMEHWRIDGLVINNEDIDLIPLNSRVRIFYYPRNNRKGYLFQQMIIDDATTNLIVYRLQALHVNGAPQWPTGLIEYTRIMTGNVREIFRQWVVDNPAHALDWFKTHA